MDNRGNIVLTGSDLTIEDVVNVAENNYTVEVSEEAMTKVKEAHTVVQKMVEDGVVAYGVTTGFGSLCDKVIDKKDAKLLSRKLIISHAVATGEPLDIKYVKSGIIVRINALIKGHSGVNPDTITAMCDLINKNVIPVIPKKGSLACSGDLCLLAHMALCISDPVLETDKNDNNVFYEGKITPSMIATKLADIKRVILGPKEGLALTNGSTFTAGIACLIHHYSTQLFKHGIMALALSCEALLAVPGAFDARIHELRNQEGQKEVARCVRALIKDSKLIGSSKNIQDAYSLRCAPQVQGVLYDILQHVENVLTKEINAVTDNPILVKENKEYKFISGGNFHGAPIGHAIDSLKSVVCDLGAISERRIFRMLDGRLNNGLPAMLSSDPGLNSGYMMKQYTAASLCLEILPLSFPSSVLSLPTCANTEDHNSNAWNAILSALTIVENTQYVITSEILCATRAIKFRLQLKSLEYSDDYTQYRMGTWTDRAYTAFLRKCLDEQDDDHLIGPELKRIGEIMNNSEFMDVFDRMITESDNNRTLDIPRGTRDFGPKQMKVRNQCMKQVEEIFVKHGAVTIETPAYELQSVLFGKYGSNQKLVFDLDDQGGAKCSLRYDLTVPLARYIAMNGLAKLKRYQMAPVFRRDNPSVTKGRFRQFMQLDYDCVGNNDLMVDDADTISVITEILDSFELNYTLKFNHKGLLDLILTGCGVPFDKLKSVCSSIDKLDKDPWSKIEKELLDKGLDAKIVKNVEQQIQFRGPPYVILKQLRKEFEEHKQIQDILDTIELLFSYLESLDCLNKLTFDTSLARGLDYYTGIIFEAVMLDEGIQVGSIAGGGRYDNLIGMFNNGKQIPAVGGSIGIERIFTIIESKMKEDKQQLSDTICYVTFMKDRKDEKKNTEFFKHVLSITNKLWKSGISAEIVMNRNEIMKVQIAETLKQGTPYMIIIAETELKKNQVIVKDLFANSGKGKQDLVKINELISHMKTKLGR